MQAKLAGRLPTEHASGFSASPVKDGVTKAALLKEKMLTALCVIYAPLTMVPFS